MYGQVAQCMGRWHNVWAGGMTHVVSTTDNFAMKSEQHASQALARASTARHVAFGMARRGTYFWQQTATAAVRRCCSAGGGTICNHSTQYNAACSIAHTAMCTLLQSLRSDDGKGAVLAESLESSGLPAGMVRFLFNAAVAENLTGVTGQQQA